MSVLSVLKSKIYSLYRYRKTLSRIPDKEYAQFLTENWIDDRRLRWNSSKKALMIEGMDIEITRDKNLFLLLPHNQIGELLLLQEKLSASFFQKNTELFVKLGGLTLNIQTNQELLIIREIFLEGIYRYIPRQPFVLLDMGMNVGFSSLFFASQALCKQTFSFEPFTPTYNQGLSNFSANPSVSGKIMALNYGLSSKNEEVEIDYSPSIRGSMSIDYWPDYAVNQTDTKKEKIALRDVKEVFEELQITSLGQDILKVAKIDCEGAEYPIMDRLTETGLLSHLDVIMMEWHLKGPEILIQELSKSGFEIFSFTPMDKYEGKFGFIYAIRTKHSGHA